MSEPIALQLGAPPWEPSKTVTMVRELNRYDVPTEGILKRRFRPEYYFFACIDGAANEYGLWVYAPIRQKEARRLKTLVGESLRRAEAGLLVGRPLVIAMAHETHGITHRSHVEIIERLTTAEPKLAREAWSTVSADLKAEAGAAARLAPC